MENPSELLFKLVGQLQQFRRKIEPVLDAVERVELLLEIGAGGASRVKDYTSKADPGRHRRFPERSTESRNNKGVMTSEIMS